MSDARATNHNVQPQLLRRRKPSITAGIIAVLGLFSGVHPFVALEVGLALEPLSAAGERALEGLLARVDLLMLYQARPLCERLLADVAAERTVKQEIRVNCQHVHKSEGKVTNRCPVWMRMCVLRLLFCLNDFWQIEH